MYDVICIGSATVDVFAHTDRSELIKIMDAHSEETLLAYPSGSKIIITELDFTIGGGGTNTSTAFARLGKKTAFLGRLGCDQNSEQVLAFLEIEGIDFVGQRGEIMGGYSIILDSIEHDRTILTYKGANNNLEYGKLDKTKFKTEWYYFCSMMERSLKSMEALAIYARRHKSRIAFNPSAYLARQGLKSINRILKYTSLLVLNCEEAEMLVGKDEMPGLLKRLHKYVPLVVITDGKKGAWAYDGKTMYHAAAHDIKVVECTGAGDAFGSTFLWGMMEKDDISFALKAATTNAESVLRHHGAKNNLATKGKLSAALKRRPVKVTKSKI
ncbi:MAG: carbohydrate kinase family protein [archaeon]